MNWIGNALLALVTGSVGSVVFVPVSQRLGEKAKVRHAAERSLHGLLRSYRQQLQYHYERSRTEQHGCPPEFAALDGQETLAESVLCNLQDLGNRKEMLLREDLEWLVGPTMLAFAEGRVHVQEFDDALAAVDRQQQQGRAFRRASGLTSDQRGPSGPLKARFTSVCEASGRRRRRGDTPHGWIKCACGR